MKAETLKLEDFITNEEGKKIIQIFFKNRFDETDVKCEPLPEPFQYLAKSKVAGRCLVQLRTFEAITCGLLDKQLTSTLRAYCSHKSNEYKQALQALLSSQESED